MTPLQSLYLGHSHRQQQRSGIRPVSEAAASAVAEVLSHQGIVPTTIARQKSPSWLQGNFGSQDGGGVVDGGGSGIKGASEKGSEEENLRASKERKVEAMKAVGQVCLIRVSFIVSPMKNPGLRSGGWM